MTNVRRPIHLQLRPSSLATATGDLVVTQTTTTSAATPTPTANTPIRPNALMNFSTGSMLATQPTTRLRPAQLIGPVDLMVSPLASGRDEFRFNNSRTKARQQHQHQNCTQVRNMTSMRQQSPKALSPSSGLNDSLPSQILPHLFVGNQEQTNRETLNKLNIKYILSLGLLPQILQSGQASISPSSPTKRTTTTTTAIATTTITTTTTTGQTNQQQQQQQKILMPSSDSSRDFKIKIRSNTPTQPMIVGCTIGGASQQQQQQLNNNNSAAAAASSNVSSAGTPSSMSHQANVVGAPTNMTPPDHYRRSNVVANDQQIPTATSSSPSTIANIHSIRNNSDENKGIGKQVRSIHCKCINISDNCDQSLMKFFDEAFAFIEEARRRKCNILVHCLAGISRSPTIAIAYLMRVKSLHWREAYDIVKQCRPQIDPNLNFMGQLRIYNKSLRNEQHEHHQQKQLDERIVTY